MHVAWLELPLRVYFSMTASGDSWPLLTSRYSYSVKNEDGDYLASKNHRLIGAKSRSNRPDIFELWRLPAL